MLAAGLLFVFGDANVCRAQGLAVSINVPFAFDAGGKTLPAGQYEIRALTADGGGARLIQSKDRESSVILLTMPLEAKSGELEPRLVFHRYGDHYFLAQVWMGGLSGRRLFVSKREKEMARTEISTELALYGK